MAAEEGTDRAADEHHRDAEASDGLARTQLLHEVERHEREQPERDAGTRATTSAA
jgi:hypothetical protein